MYTSKYWKKGDLLVSLKHKSTVFLYRPSTNKILWLKTGPWLSQHDVDFIDSTRIGIFGNNIIRYNWGDILINGYNEEYIYNFKTGAITTPYTAFLKGAKVSTRGEGRSDILADNNLFIEDTEHNRLLIGNENNVVLQYVASIDKNTVSALAWTRYITQQEFKKLKFLRER
ncbi:MAG: hypothetical protein NVSMB24_12610 [Mucilaginibacter sp.]